MNIQTAAALRAIQDAVELLQTEIADTEPAPITVVLVRAPNGTVHRAARIEGIPGLMTFEADNVDSAGSFDVIPDLSTVADDLDLCGRCFGSLDHGEEGNE